jgi:hypothetical protein
MNQIFDAWMPDFASDSLTHPSLFTNVTYNEQKDKWRPITKALGINSTQTERAYEQSIQTTAYPVYTVYTPPSPYVPQNALDIRRPKN